jgi:uncharacterized protein YaaR (DUF327 family)
LQLDKIRGALPGVLKQAERETASHKPSGFARELINADKAIMRERLDAMIKQVEKQADRLSRNLTIKELMRYKGMLRECLKEALNGGLYKDDTKHWDRKGRLKVLTIMKRIDEKLDELDCLISENRSLAPEILAKLGEIQGLLVDLYA